MKRIILALAVLAAAYGGELRAQELRDLSLEQLLNLEVETASRFPQPLTEAPATLYVLTARDIHVLGAASVVDLLRSVPGLDVMTAWDTEVEVGARGLDALQNARLLVLLDGHRVNEDFSGAVRWKELPVLMEDIERVEVSLSPNSALYGANAFSGIVQIFTKPPAARRGLRLGARAGNKEDQGYSAAYGGAVGKVDFTLTAATDKTEGWGNRKPGKVDEAVQPIPPSVIGGAAKFKDWSELSRLMLRADLPSGTDGRLSLRGGIVSGVLSSPDLISTAGKAANNPMATHNGYAQLVYERELSGRAGIEARLGASYWRYRGKIQPYLTMRQDGEARYWRRLGDNLRLTAGLAGETVQADSAYLVRPRVNDHFYAGYGQLELWPEEPLSVTGGLRYDKHKDMTGVFSPRGAAVLALGEGHSLRYNTGSAFRKASVLETYALSGSVGAGLVQGQLEYPGGRRRPEHISYHDLSYEGQLHERMTLRTGLFRYAVRDLILLHKIQPYAPYLYAVQYQNLQGLNIYGAESELRWAPGGAFQTFANASYQDLHYLSQADTQRLSVPQLKWNLGLTYEKPQGLAGSLVLRHVGAKTAQFGIVCNDGITRFMDIGSYTTLDGKLAYSAQAGGGTLEFGLTVLNAFDNKHIEYPVSDGSNSYFGRGSTPYNADQRQAYENRNALNDRRVLADVTWRF